MPRSVGRALDLLEIVLDHGPCNLTTAAELAGLTPTTALRHLRALEARGYLVRDDDGVFDAGPTLVRLGARAGAHGALDRLMAAAQPHLDRLARRTGESTYLAVADGRTVTYVAAAEGTRAIRHVGWVGQSVPIDGTAVGAAMADSSRVHVRTGTVEPDITALSFAVPIEGSVRAAVSVLGPATRLGRGRRSPIARELRESVAALAAELGEDAAVAS